MAWWQWVAPAAALAATLIWRPQRDEFYRKDERSSVRAARDHVLLRFASQDWLLLGYLLVLLALVLVGDGPRRSPALAALGAVTAVFAGILWRVRRGGSQPRNVSGGLLYRFGILVALLGSFVELHLILPAASGAAVDAELHAFDLRVFGIEPAVAWDRFVTPPVTEWFSFYYYGYFVIVAVHVFPALFLGRDQKFLTTFGFGFLWLYCVGHIVYTIVPAYGPYAHLSFQHPLEGGRWWPLVQRTVASGGARTDVFPSLHTAGPVYLTLYSIIHRRRSPFRYTWVPLAFASTQIVIATMFLRWHYLVDIFAGIAVAVSGIFAGRLAHAWDAARVDAGGLPSWPTLTLPPAPSCPLETPKKRVWNALGRR